MHFPFYRVTKTIFCERNGYNYETVNFWLHIISKMCFITCKQTAKIQTNFQTLKNLALSEVYPFRVSFTKNGLGHPVSGKMWKLIFFTSKLFLFKFGYSKNKTFLLLPHIKRLCQSKPLYNKPFNYWINCRMNAFLWDYVTLKMGIFLSKWFSIWYILCVVEVYLCRKHFYGLKKKTFILYVWVQSETTFLARCKSK